MRDSVSTAKGSFEFLPRRVLANPASAAAKLHATPTKNDQSNLAEAGGCCLSKQRRSSSPRCSSSRFFKAAPQHTKISDLMADPGRYRDKEITISGMVTQSFGALGTGSYQVDDGTGKIWILSEQSGVPSQGAKVTGRVIEGATLGGRSLGTALRESHRKT